MKSYLSPTISVQFSILNNFGSFLKNFIFENSHGNIATYKNISNVKNGVVSNIDGQIEPWSENSPDPDHVGPSSWFPGVVICF